MPARADCGRSYAWQLAFEGDIGLQLPERNAVERMDDMPTVKERMTDVIQSQPDDASYEEIMRELAFERMVDRGLEDSRKGRVISNVDMERRLRSWRN